MEKENVEKGEEKQEIIMFRIFHSLSIKLQNMNAVIMVDYAIIHQLFTPPPS